MYTFVSFYHSQPHHRFYNLVIRQHQTNPLPPYPVNYNSLFFRYRKSYSPGGFQPPDKINQRSKKGKVIHDNMPEPMR